MRIDDNERAEGLVLETADPHRSSTLKAIADLVRMAEEEVASGWTDRSARLYAIDCAQVVYRRQMARMSEAEHRLFNELLNEARRLTMAGRQPELGFVQGEIARLIGSQTVRQTREAWLVAADALLPSPYRAALVASQSLLVVEGRGAAENREKLILLMRGKLAARTTEVTQDRIQRRSASEAGQISMLRSMSQAQAARRTA